ncbi:MAG: site-specific integrase [Rikenellaceae bacterium]
MGFSRTKSGTVSGTTRKDVELNHRLDTIRLRIMQIYRQMEIDGRPITAKAILDEYQGKNVKDVVTICDVFSEHNERCHKLIGKDMSKSTVERYETCLRHLKQFLKFTFGQEDIPIEDINHKFIKDFEFWYKTEKNCAHNTTTKYLKNFKKIIRIALANEIITRDPFANIRFSLDEVEREFLEDHELQTIINKEFGIERLEQVRDVFVFCSMTGLAFSDVKQLKEEHISIDNNGAMWIRKRRQKTNNMCNIPLLDIAQQILEKYKDHSARKNGALLVVPSNQKFNAYLKEVADLCGIKKLISSHTASHGQNYYSLNIS